ncbi:MAG: phosphoribosyltransferase-like protein [Planctomycetota bacterium]
MARQSLEVRYHDDIEFAVSEYGDHSGVTRARVVRWMRQVASRRQPLAARVLRSLRYYADNNLRSMARQLAEAVYSEYSEIQKNRIFFVPIGRRGSGADQVARYLRTLRLVANTRIVELIDLHRKPAEEIDVVVAFDDFSGTGQTIREWWDMNATLILPKQADLVLGVLVLNHLARPPLEEISEQIMAIDELSEKYNVFDDDCERFTKNEKRSLLTLCRATGCSDAYLKGRGECGLLVVFKHGCPNNSLPILWHHREGAWEALFQRRAP